MDSLPRSDVGPFRPYILALLQAFTWGRCPPQSVPLFRHASSPSLLLPIGRDYFSNLYLVIPPSYSCSHDLWRWNSVPKRRHIKLRSRGITQKKDYNVYLFIYLCNVYMYVILWSTWTKVFLLSCCTSETVQKYHHIFSQSYTVCTTLWALKTSFSLFLWGK